MATGSVEAKKTRIHVADRKPCTTSLAYSGLSITIPTGKSFVISASAHYNSSSPSAIAIRNASSGSPVIFASGGNVEGLAQCTYCGTTVSEATYYVWVKYGSAGNNDIDIDGYYF